MAKKIVKVNEEKIRGYMVGDIPDAIENEDIIVVEVPEEENNERQDTEKETARKNPKPCNMPECDSNFRQKYLVNTLLLQHAAAGNGKCYGKMCHLRSPGSRIVCLESEELRTKNQRV